MNGTAGVCENLIKHGRTDGMVEKLNNLRLFDQITEEEYIKLMKMLEVDNKTA